MNNKRKKIIRAALAALIFLTLIYLMTGGESRPLPAFLSGGDIWIETTRPFVLEDFILTSGILGGCPPAPEIKQIISVYAIERNQLNSLLYRSWGWIGGGPWRVAVALAADNSPVIVIGAGRMAFLGKTLFKRSGFKPGAQIEGHEALVKDQLAFIRLKGFWIIGSQEGAAKVVRAFKSNSSWWKPKFWPDKEADCILAISPGYLRKLITLKEGSSNFESVMKEWLDWDEWGGLVATLEIKKEQIEAKAWMPLAEDKPIVRLWSKLGNESSSLGRLNSQTVFAARINVDDPAKIFEKAKKIYSTRPGALKLIKGIEEELRRELHIELVDLLKQTKQEVGFAGLIYNDKIRTILFAGAVSGTGGALKKMEASVPGTWQPGFEGMEIRFMPRLLAYTFTNGKILMASDPKVLSAYLKKPFNEPIPDDIRKIADRFSSEPLAAIGKWPVGTSAQGVQGSAGWYAAGVNYSKGRFEGHIIKPYILSGKQPVMPWGPRLLGWGIGVARIIGWILAALSLGVFLINVLSLREQSRSKSKPVETPSQVGLHFEETTPGI